MYFRNKKESKNVDTDIKFSDNLFSLSLNQRHQYSDFFTGDIRMYANGKLDTVRRIRKILRPERGHRKGDRRGGRGGSGPREEKCDKDFGI